MHLYCDHLALLASKVDCTTGVMHAVLTEENANEVTDFLLNRCKKIQKNVGKQDRIVLNVILPNDTSSRNNLIIDIIELDQLRSSDDVAHLKGHTHFDPELISNITSLDKKTLSKWNRFIISLIS